MELGVTTTPTKLQGANEENMAVSELLELAERWRDESPGMDVWGHIRKLSFSRHHLSYLVS